MEFLQGYRTYIIAGVLAVLAAGNAVGLVPDNVFKDVSEWLVPLGLVTARFATARTDAKAP